VAAGHQLAQAPAPGGSPPIGRVDTVTGTVTAQHVDGTVETLTQGSSVYARDMLATNAGAKVALVFADKTTFALGESGQMRLDEMIYDPAHKDGKLALSMLKGAFAFVSGDIAATQADAMTVRTPVGTIGIRGTAVEGKVSPDGSSRFGAVHDPSGHQSTIVFTNGAGTTVVTEDFSITVQGFFNAPSSPFASPGGQAGELSALMSIASGIASSINPGGSGPAGPAAPVGPLPGQSLQTLAPAEPTIHIGLTGDINAVNGPAVTFTVTETIITDLTQDQPQQPPVQLTVPPPPPPDTDSNGAALGPYVGQLDQRNDFTGTPHADLFDFTTHPDSLKSGDFINGAGGNDTLAALFDKPFAIDGTLQIINVPNIEITLGGGANTLDALGIVSGFSGPSTISVAGSGSLTVTDLQVSLDGHEMTGALIATAIPITGGGGIVIEGGTADDSLTGAGYGQGDFLSYQHALVGVTVDFATGTAIHGGSTDTIAGFDGVIGSAFDDNINVSLTGGGHSFTVEGGAGNNTLTGALTDNDFLTYVEVPSGVSATFANGSGTVDNGLGGTDIFSGFKGIILNFGDVAIDGTADIVTVSGLANVIASENGNDTIDATGGGFDTITMGNGADSLTLSGTSYAVTVGGGADTIGANSGFDTITVGNGADVLNLNGVVYSVTTASTSPGDDTILGGASFDTIVANGNNDLISLGGGVVSITVDDAMGGGGSSETISVGLGFDTIVGIGNDHFSISALGGVVSVTADGNGDDRISVGGGFDTVSVGNGDDYISVSGSGGLPVSITAGSGDDTVMGNGGAETVSLGGGCDDVISIVGGGNVLSLNAEFNEVTIAGGGNFITSPSYSDDAISITGGNNTISVGGGCEQLISVVGGNNSITIGSGCEAEVFVSGGGNNISIGGSSDDLISITGGGDDTIVVGSGNDVINVSGNGDIVTAGSGCDAIGMFGSGDVLSLNIGNGLDTLSISGNNDLMVVALAGGPDSSFNFSLGATGTGDAFSITGEDGSVSVSGTYQTFAISFGGCANVVEFSGGDDTIAVGGSAAFTQVNLSGNDDVLILGSGVTVNTESAATVETILGGGGDTVSLGAPTDTLTIANISNLSVSPDAQGATLDVTVTGLAPSTVFDFTNANSSASTLTLDIAGSTTVTIGQNGGDSLELIGASAAPGVSELVLENGNYNLTFDGTELNGGSMTVDASQLGVGSSLTFNGESESGHFYIYAGAAFETFTVPGTGADVLDYTKLPGPVALTITAFNCSEGTLSGFGPLGSTETFGDSASGAGFGTLKALVGSELVFAPSVDSDIITNIDLVNGLIHSDEGTATITGFSAVIYEGNANIGFNAGSNDAISVAGGSDTFELGGGHDSITAGNGTNSLSDTTGGGGDLVNFGNGNDTVSLYNGTDIIVVGSGADLISSFGIGDTIMAPGNGSAITAAGAGDVVTANGVGDNITAGGVGDTITAMGGGDNIVNLGSGTTITLGGPGDSVGESTNPSAPIQFDFLTPSASPGSNPDQIANFVDTGGAASIIDLTGLSGVGTETFAGLKSGASVAIAFASDAANAVDYAQIGGNTYVHAASSAGGYSTSDLLIELTGAHTLTAANIHLHA
jgi:hypothetical protein